MTWSLSISRRTLLAATTALPLLMSAACTTGEPKKPEPAPVDPLADVLAMHVTLRTAYDAAVTAFADIAPRLQPLREHVDEHISALAAAQAIAPPSASSSEASSAGASSAGGAGSDSPPPPPDSATAVTGLITQENALVDALTPLVVSEPAERAPLLGAITASHVCHVAALS